MTLLVDERASLLGQPGCHALIVGISAYPHLPVGNQPATPHSFGMKQLSSAALTAEKIYQWLLEQRNHLPVPLVTCRLLLSPSPSELQAEPTLPNLTDRGTLHNFLVAAHEWRADASTHSENMTFFYFAGHGVQLNQNEVVMLLEGFGSGIGAMLRNGVEVKNLFRGMAPSRTRANIARTQWYFVDTCRNLPSKLKNFERMSTTPVFDIELGRSDNRCAPIFYAAVPGSKAYALRGEQTVFSKALLHCLRHTAAERYYDEEGHLKWRITVSSLFDALESYFEGLDRTQKADQEFVLSGLVKHAVLHYLSGPPSVTVILELQPVKALPFAHVQVTDAHNKLVRDLPPPLTPHPYEDQLPAGIYHLRITFESGNSHQFTYVVRLLEAMPPRHFWKVKVK